MIAANRGMVTVSYLESSVVAILRFEYKLSRVLLVTSSALAAMAMSSPAVLGAADFVPGAAPACLISAKYLNLAARKRGESAENELLGLENPEEGRPGIVVALWRRIKRRYKKIRNRDDREVEMTPDEPKTICDRSDPSIEITEDDLKVILGPITDLITL